MRAKVSRSPALLDPTDFRAAAPAGKPFAVVVAKYFFQAGKPPLRIPKIGRRVKAAF
jgi:hypothetical protein